MTDFQRQFIVLCMRNMKSILTDNNKLESAVLIFNEVKTTEAPYKIAHHITDVALWSDKEQKALCATVLQAVATASYKLAFTPKNIDALGDATDMLLEDYLPKITSNTDLHQRLESVRTNIEKIELVLQQTEKENEDKNHSEQQELNSNQMSKQANTFENNNYTFFPVAAVTAAVSLSAALFYHYKS